MQLTERQERVAKGGAKRSYEFDRTGLYGEQAVTQYLKSIGHDVLVAEATDDILYDIDIILDGVPTSIKTQHTGLQYGDIYCELTTQINNRYEWDKDSLKFMAAVSFQFPNLRETIGWTSHGWHPSWFLTGKAQQYLILQGNELRLYRKDAFKGKFYKCRGLSGKLLHGTQRRQNTVCLYARRCQVDYECSWVLLLPATAKA